MRAVKSIVDAILADPESDDLRRQCAARLGSLGDPRGEFIRLQLDLVEMRRDPDRGGAYHEASARASELLRQHGARWAAEVAPMVEGWTFRRGFIDEVKVKASAFDAVAPGLYARAPVLHLEVIEAAGTMGALCASAHLGRIVSLGLFGQRIGDEGVRALAGSTHLGRLSWLDLGHNGIGEEGLEVLCASAGLPRLRWVNLGGNPAPNPTPRPVMDGGVVMGYDRPDLADEIEARFGALPWLNETFEDTRFGVPEQDHFVGR